MYKRKWTETLFPNLTVGLSDANGKDFIASVANKEFLDKFRSVALRSGGKVISINATKVLEEDHAEICAILRNLHLNGGLNLRAISRISKESWLSNNGRAELHDIMEAQPPEVIKSRHLTSAIKKAELTIIKAYHHTLESMMKKLVLKQLGLEGQQKCEDFLNEVGRLVKLYSNEAEEADAVLAATNLLHAYNAPLSSKTERADKMQLDRLELLFNLNSCSHPKRRAMICEAVELATKEKVGNSYGSDVKEKFSFDLKAFVDRVESIFFRALDSFNAVEKIKSERAEVLRAVSREVDYDIPEYLTNGLGRW